MDQNGLCIEKELLKTRIPTVLTFLVGSSRLVFSGESILLPSLLTNDNIGYHA